MEVCVDKCLINLVFQSSIDIIQQTVLHRLKCFTSMSYLEISKYMLSI